MSTGCTFLLTFWNISLFMATALNGNNTWQLHIFVYYMSTPAYFSPFSYRLTHMGTFQQNKNILCLLFRCWWDRKPDGYFPRIYYTHVIVLILVHMPLPNYTSCLPYYIVYTEVDIYIYVFLDVLMPSLGKLIDSDTCVIISVL